MLPITPYLKYSTQDLSEAPIPPGNSTCLFAWGLYSVSTNTPSQNIHMLSIFLKRKKLVMETKSNSLEASSIMQLINSSILFTSSILGRLEISMDCCISGENVQVVGTLS